MGTDGNKYHVQLARDQRASAFSAVERGSQCAVHSLHACSDLGSGLFNILLSAGLCSTASPFLLREYPYLATIVGFAMWWFTFVSMYSLCWLILSKNVAIAMPFRSDENYCHARDATLSMY